MQFVLALFFFFLIVEHCVAFYMKMLEAFSYLSARLDSTYIHAYISSFIVFYSVGFVHSIL